MKKTLIFVFSSLMLISQAYSLAISKVVVSKGELCKETQFDAFLSSDAKKCVLFCKRANYNIPFQQIEMPLCSRAENRYSVTLPKWYSSIDGLIWYIVAEDASRIQRFYGTPEFPKTHSFAMPPKIDDKNMIVSLSIDKLMFMCKTIEPGMKVGIIFTNNDKSTYSNQVTVTRGMKTMQLLGCANTDTTGTAKNGFDKGDGISVGFSKYSGGYIMDYTFSPSETKLIFKAGTTAKTDAVLNICPDATK